MPNAETMSGTATSGRFGLHRIDELTWEIREVRLPTYAARPVAHVTVSEDDEVEVIWSAPLPLPTTFATPSDALDSLEFWSGSSPGSTKPILIPHYPPPPH